jgi:uncharacterized protein YyaL (SSP411 family)
VPAALDPRGDMARKNVLFVDGQSDAVDERLREGREKLLAVRLKRPPPAADAKIITSTNARAIALFARAALELRSDAYARVAAGAARSLLARNLDSKKGILYRARDRRSISATVDDYVRLIDALLVTYGVTFDVYFLEQAIALQKRLDRDLRADGTVDAERSVPPAVRGLAPEDPDRGALVAANLDRLAQVTNDTAWRKRSQPALGVVVIGGSPQAADAAALIEAGRARDEFVLVATSRTARDRLARLAPALKNVELPRDGKAFATICYATGCRSATQNPDELRAWPK